jgi:hypothetical protein
MTGLWSSVERLRHFPDSPGKLRSSFRYGASDLWQSLLCQRRDRSGRHGKQFAGSHANQWKKLLCRFIL